MTGKTPDTLPWRISRAFRVRSDGPRTLYVAGRRMVSWPRTVGRHALARRLPPGPLTIPAAAGFITVPPGRFDEGPLVADALEARERYLAQPEAASAPGRKRFLVNVLDRHALRLDSSYMRFALREDILTAVSRYLGVVPLLTTISVFHSDSSTAAPTSSQLHHCDGDDTRQIKVFVHCTDVTPQTGPLSVVRADESARVRRATGYRYGGRLTDAQLEAVAPGQVVPILGPPGSTCFVDTSRCFHYGSRVEPGAPSRLVVMVQYQTPYSFMLPVAFAEGAPFRHLQSDVLSPLQRLVLGQA